MSVEISREAANIAVLSEFKTDSRPFRLLRRHARRRHCVIPFHNPKRTFYPTSVLLYHHQIPLYRGIRPARFHRRSAFLVQNNSHMSHSLANCL